MNSLYLQDTKSTFQNSYTLTMNFLKQKSKRIIPFITVTKIKYLGVYLTEVKDFSKKINNYKTMKEIE